MKVSICAECTIYIADYRDAIAYKGELHHSACATKRRRREDKQARVARISARLAEMPDAAKGFTTTPGRMSDG